MKFGDGININLGYSCNYRCRHCVTSSGPDKKDTSLTEDEIHLLCETIQKHRPQTILFTGGEPTLFTEVLNRIVEAHPALETAKVMITSNGWYGSSERNTEKILSEIKKLDAVQMSFDVFHGNESKTSYVKTISEYCKKRGIEFNVTMCLTNPMDLVKAQPLLKDLQVNVIFQPVITTGRAAENNLGFYYPAFEQETLNKKCPSASAVYVPQQGFSHCASSLVYGKDPLNKAISPSIEAHAQSDFYQELSTLTMGELAEKYKVDTSSLPASLSHVCHLCEYIHCKAGA